MKTVDAARLCATIRAARPLDQPVRHGAPAEAWTGRASGGRIRRRKSDEASGMLRGHDGLIRDNTFAAYTHIHAEGAPHWAPLFVVAAARYRGEKMPPAAGEDHPPRTP
jgi:hypothetical protein